MTYKQTQERLIALIRILYGLAIVSGAKTAADYYFQNPSWCAAQTRVYFILTGSALFVGLSDWLMYHFVVSEHPYSDIWRLVADILFPVGIFSLFYALRWPLSFFILLGVYFIACWIYIRVIWGDLQKKEKRLLGFPVGIAVCVAVLSAVLRTIIGNSFDFWAAIIAAISCVIWIILNLSYVRRYLRKVGKCALATKK